jgi:hypothetical protein
MTKRPTNIIDRYLNFIKALFVVLTDKKTVTEGWKKYKNKLFIGWFVFITVVTCINVWRLGDCVGCDQLTESQLQDKDAATLIALYAHQPTIPYTSWSAYLKDLPQPILVTWFLNICGLTFIYLAILTYTLFQRKLLEIIKNKKSFKR